MFVESEYLEYLRDLSIKKFLEKYNCPYSDRELRTYVAGQICNSGSKPPSLDAIHRIWRGNPPKLKSSMEEKMLIMTLEEGYWERLLDDRARAKAFTLSAAPDPVRSLEGVRQRARIRAEEVDAFLRGLLHDFEVDDSSFRHRKPVLEILRSRRVLKGIVNLFSEPSKPTSVSTMSEALDRILLAEGVIENNINILLAET